MAGGELLYGSKSCNTDPSESSWPDQLHQLVVAHVAQKVLQTAFAWRGHVKQRRLLVFFGLKKKKKKRDIFYSTQAAFTSQSRELVSSATTAKSTRDGRVVEILVHFTAELLVLISLWFLTLEKEISCNIYYKMAARGRVLLQSTTRGRYRYMYSI